MIKPNLFIVGAAKSGTTSLAYYLDQHPDIFITPIKEPFYYVSGVGINDYDEYLSLFKNAGDVRLVGEASTGYLFDDEAAKRIKSASPDAKIVIILRDPVEMVFSYWQYMFLIGNEEKTLEEAISEQERLFRKTEEFKKKAFRWWASYIYLDRALYYEQVKRYLDVFKRDQVRIYSFEEFFADPVTHCRDLYMFLGVDGAFSPKFAVKNEGGVLRSRLLHRIRNKEYPFLRKMVPVEWRYKLRYLFLQLSIRKGKRIPMKPATRIHLTSFYREDVEKLEKLLGRKMPCWQSSKYYRHGVC